ncbi:MAG: signal peptidase I [Candidatus Moranbacteria bacterium]|nr:signal peptidase I [Candidatus Moranbacteria bacterium]
MEKIKEAKLSETKIEKQVKQEDPNYGVGSFLFEVIKVFVWALLIILPIRIFVFQPFFVQGASMEPNFKNGDYLVINELGYKQTDIDIIGNHLFRVEMMKDLKRGEVVVFRYPRNPDQYFIKRVVGLPGEQVKIADGKVRIYNKENPGGVLLDENGYLKEGLSTSGTIDITLSNDQYFVLGDNRQNSSDSRVWGPLPKNDIIGKVLLKAWPLSKLEIL